MQDDDAIYKVVVNQEGQYSIWPADKPNALGWTDYGFSGRKEEALRRIEEIWTDMRPVNPNRKTDTSGGGP
ncbi:MAG TPA: MbtH family protein [Thermoanaerobaculia bacterium]|nr:MbtH family protein [Thermoanaerobaculia bacterium]